MDWTVTLKLKPGDPMKPVKQEVLAEQCQSCGFWTQFIAMPPPGEPFRCYKCGAPLV